MSELLTVTRATGWLALLGLSAALCVTPLARLTAQLGMRATTRAAALRRWLGISSAYLGLLHASAAAIELHDGSLHWLVATPHIRAGLSTLVVLVALLLTSFPLLVQRLHLRGWKELHRLAYVALACAAQHVLLSPFAPRRWLLGLLSCVLGVGLLRLWRMRAAT